MVLNQWLLGLFGVDTASSKAPVQFLILSQRSLSRSLEGIVWDRQQVCKRGPCKILGGDAKPPRLAVKTFGLGRRKFDSQLHGVSVPSCDAVQQV